MIPGLAAIIVLAVLAVWQGKALIKPLAVALPLMVVFLGWYYTVYQHRHVEQPFVAQAGGR
jgi:hypothetical protein